MALASTAGASFTAGSSVSATDVMGLRSTLNLKRVACGLTKITWTDDTLTPVTPIKQVHLNELRTAVTGAYASQALPAPTYTDPVISSSLPIKAIHFQELSTKMAALSCTPPAVPAGNCNVEGDYYWASPRLIAVSTTWTSPGGFDSEKDIPYCTPAGTGTCTGSINGVYGCASSDLDTCTGLGGKFGGSSITFTCSP